MSDEEILYLFKKNDPGAWEHLYDKYASAIYGLIFSLTEDKIVAEKIFEATFVQLKAKGILLNVAQALCPTLLRYTHAQVLRQLTQYGLVPKTLSALEEVGLIHFLCTQCHSLKEAASILHISEAEARKKLRSEFIKLQEITYLKAEA